MAINKLTPVDFNQRIQIGTVKTVQNPINGTSKQTFISQFSLYCAPYTRSIAYSYQLTAEQLEQVVVIIRHNPKVYEEIMILYEFKPSERVISDKYLTALERSISCYLDEIRTIVFQSLQ